MVTSVIQTSFHAGEWAPALNARVDLAKYHSAAATMRNFFVDYRGGASTRAGTKYILQVHNSGGFVRLIRFQASFTVSYVLEFGENYIRFFNNGAPVLETAKVITGITNANPAVVTIAAHGFQTGEWVYITGVGGMTQLNGKYYIVGTTTTNTFALLDLFHTPINTIPYVAYTFGGTAARIYIIYSPYPATQVQGIKVAQNVNTMVLCHPLHQPFLLTLISANNWTLVPITFGSTVATPTNLAVATTLGAGSANYAYIVTAVDSNDQESAISAFATLASKLDLRTTAGTNTVSWNAVSGALSYNIYKAQLSYAGAIPVGSQFGFVGNVTGVSFIDSNVAPDFSQTPPIVKNPFQGAGVLSATVTAPGTYTTVPTVVFGAAPAGGVTATSNPVLQVQGTPAVVGGGFGNDVGDIMTFVNGVVLVVATVSGLGAILTFQPVTYLGSNPGAVTNGATPTNPVTGTNPRTTNTCTVTLTWGVGLVAITSPGFGYTSAPSITFSAGAATATSTLGATSNGNPTVPIYYQQRLVLAGPPGNPQQFDMSQPGSYFNFNIRDPIQADDAIEGVIVSNQLNTIKSMVGMPSGLATLCDQQAWLINGGSAGTPITPIDATANSQAYGGASDVQPIVVNYDILYIQSKGSIVRDLTYNFYTNIYTGTDISVLSSHLFYGYTLTGWAFAEEPFKVVWAVRSDGILLTLTFLKEQELIGWAHSDTLGHFESVTTVTETVSFGAVDATYVVVQRVVNGQTLRYIERFAERIFVNGAADAWCVDAGLQYSGTPATNFGGGEHLTGMTVTGLADGVAIPPFTMPVGGNFTLTSAASKVTVGLAFLPQLKTLQLDLGEPTAQGKRKKISAVTVRCQETLGLSIGKDFTSLVPMKDLVVGNVGSATNQVVTNLVTGDARTIIDPSWDVPGQYCIQQSYPLPATVLGVIPEIVVGDTVK